jgi:hypothetical protein
MPKLLVALSLLAGLLLPGYAFGQIRVINTLTDFEQFWGAAQGKPFEQQEQLWAAFEAKYPDIYQGIVFPRSNPNWQQSRTSKLKSAFSDMPAMAPRIMAILEQADAIANAQLATFLKEFPDLAAGTPVIFIPLSTFNAAVRPAAVMTSTGRTSLVLGVDYLIENDDALDAVFMHEFFHIYQFDGLEGRPYGSNMASPLWFEGFATYLSARLNPSVATKRIYMDSELATACTPDNIRKWSGEYLQLYRKEVDKAMHTAWFRVSTKERPKRRGYCVGAQVVQLLAQSHSLLEMAKWDETIYEPHIGAALEKLAMPLMEKPAQ